MANKAYKIRLYPTPTQKVLIDKTCGCSRFIYNQMLAERITVYDLLKDDKEALYNYQYKTEKQYKEEFEFLSEVSSRALQQSRIDLNTAYKNFYKRIKQGKKGNAVGFPKFKSKHRSKNSYREPQVGTTAIEIRDNKIKLLKLGWVSFKGLSKDFNGKIKSITITARKDGKYEASILVETHTNKKERKNNNAVGIDLGIKEFIICSNGEFHKGIKDELFNIERNIKKQQKHLSRKIVQNKKNGLKNSKRQDKCRKKLARLYQYKSNFQNHYFWHLVNHICEENQFICIEDLNTKGMIKNRKLSHSIYYSGWGKFTTMLEQKAKEYDSEVARINRFFPSSKLCSECGQIKEDLTLADRLYKCDCGLEIDRDLNASFNILKEGLNSLSLEYSDYRRGETVRPREIIYNFEGSFCETFTKNEVA